MPHQCVRCNALHDDGSKKLLAGCDCGAKVFFYIRKEQYERKKKTLALNQEQRETIEKDVLDLVGKVEPDEPIILDLESINVKGPGKYELDLVRLFKGEPLIVKLEDGKYIIDLAESFEKLKKK